MSQPPPSLPAASTTPVTLRRRYPDAPLVGVAAVVFDPRGQVLLVKRGRPPRVGQWGLPGGLLDLGERLVDGARREVREECGIEIEIAGIAGAFDPIERDADGRVEYHYVVVDFWARYLSGEPRAQDDADDLAWVELADLEQYPMPPETRRVIRDAFVAWRGS